MKNLKVVSLFIISIVIISIANISFAKTGIVNTPAVRVREKASTDSEILTKAYEDEEVEILGEEGDWYKVSVNGKTGYASKSLIKVNEENTSSKPENKVTENNTNSNTISNENTQTNNTTNSTSVNNATPSENTNSNEAASKCVIKEDVSIKILPNFSSNNIALLTKDTEVKIEKELGKWAEVVAGDSKGWILKNKINVSNEEATPSPAEPENKEPEKPAQTEPEKPKTDTQTSEARNKKGTINVETANIREKADKSSSIIYHLDEGDEVTIIAEEGDWYKITNKEVKSGYVSKTLVTVSDVSSRSPQEIRDELVSAETNIQTSNVSKGKGTDVVNYAKQYLGCNYVLGGKTPENGFDCSGFTKYVFKNFGYNLGSVAASQDTVGKEVGRDNLKEGDLILFYNEEKTKIGHTGIYIGGDQFIHAANPERGVVIDDFSSNSYYSSRFVTARRVVE